MTEAILDQNVFNDADGKRPWHERVFAVDPRESDVPGVIVWIGSKDLIYSKFPYNIIALKGEINSQYYRRNPQEPLFTGDLSKRVIRSDGGTLAHLPPPSLLKELYNTLNPLKGVLDISGYEVSKPNIWWGCGKA